jgi:hypothetical protein
MPDLALQSCAVLKRRPPAGRFEKADQGFAGHGHDFRVEGGILS